MVHGVVSKGERALKGQPNQGSVQNPEQGGIWLCWACPDYMGPASHTSEVMCRRAGTLPTPIKRRYCAFKDEELEQALSG